MDAAADLAEGFGGTGIAVFEGALDVAVVLREATAGAALTLGGTVETVSALVVAAVLDEDATRLGPAFAAESGAIPAVSLIARDVVFRGSDAAGLAVTSTGFTSLTCLTAVLAGAGFTTVFFGTEAWGIGSETFKAFFIFLANSSVSSSSSTAFALPFLPLAEVVAEVEALTVLLVLLTGLATLVVAIFKYSGMFVWTENQKSRVE